MANLHVTQIKNKFIEYFDQKIDISDYDGRPEDQRVNAFCSRGLAAYAIAILTGKSYEIAAIAVTDEGNDGGIDAIYFDEDERILSVVQAKWSDEGRAQIDQEAMLKFLSGVRKLISANYNAFLVKKADGTSIETKVYKKRDEVQRALKDHRARLRLILAYTGTDDLQRHAAEDLKRFVDEQNQASELVHVEIVNLSRVHGTLDQHAVERISPDIELFQWGLNTAPYESFYGQISGAVIGELFKKFGVRLFAPNLRVFMGNTAVNDDITETALRDPERFWYFNNGITALCESIEKLPYGGSIRDFGVFKCTGLSIVNGAQTVGSMHRAYIESPASAERSRISIRLISLKDCPPEVGDQITRYTNTQNGIGKKDFAALDSKQMELQRELRIDGISYAVKSGEVIDDKSKGFDFNEAMVALACAHPDLSMAVTAKREVSKLWDDIARPPYTNLVSRILGPELWKLVRIQRMIDERLALHEDSLSGRSSLIIVHGNRLIAHIVFSEIKRIEGAAFRTQLAVDKSKVESLVELVASILIEQIQDPENGYIDSYPGSLFKNREKCLALNKIICEEIRNSEVVPTS